MAIFDAALTDILGFGVALCAMSLIAYGFFGRPNPPIKVFKRLSNTTEHTFLFDGHFLIDSSAGAAALLLDTPEELPDVRRLCHLMQFSFPQLLAEIDKLHVGETKILPSSDDSDLHLRLVDENGLTRVSLKTGAGYDAQTTLQTLERAAHAQELQQLRTITNQAPQLIWEEDQDGRLIWANTRYLEMADLLPKPNGSLLPIWPKTRIFGTSISAKNDAPKGVESHQRCALKIADGAQEFWFDIHSTPTAQGVLHFASTADAAVRAERMQREFLQTLSKTFAELSVGMAIFNKRRQLTMFNPAFLEITSLPFQLLSTKPNIDTILDRLRDIRKLPEPKNYKNWRDQFSALEEDALNGGYCENWDLPDGQTLRVSARPHPDGAIALLFEDISAEISMARRFRTEIETSNAVVDTLPDAIAVFSSANMLVMTNAAYRKLWNQPAEESVIATDLRSALKLWRTSCAATLLWGHIEDIALSPHDRCERTDTIMLLDGRRAICHTMPLSGGQTMIKFDVNAQVERRNPFNKSDHAMHIVAG